MCTKCEEKEKKCNGAKSLPKVYKKCTKVVEVVEKSVNWIYKECTKGVQKIIKRVRKMYEKRAKVYIFDYCRYSQNYHYNHICH